MLVITPVPRSYVGYTINNMTPIAVAAPIIWNELPTTLKSCESLASFRKNLKNLFLQNCFSTLNSRRPLKLMMTPACPRLLDMINDFVLLRF